MRPSVDEILAGAAAWYGLGARALGFVYPFDDSGTCTCSNPSCGSPGKHPVGGPQAVYSDVGGLAGALGGFRWAPGLFLPTGAVNGITVIDGDLHGEDDGAFMWEQWLAACDVALPAGLRQRTGSGGEHIFVQYVPGLKAKTGLKGCIDIRNDGGLVVVAPSLHVSGRRYQLDTRAPVVPALPEEFAEELRRTKGRKPGSRALGSGAGGVDGVSGRDDAANAHAFQCKKLGLSEGDALESMRELWETFDQPPVASHRFEWVSAVEKVQNVYRDDSIQPDAEHHPEWVAKVAAGEAEVYALGDGHRPTDVGNANRLAAVADGRIRYVDQWGKWLVYEDGVWHIDAGNVRVTGWAKRVPREMFKRAADMEGHAREQMWVWAKKSESSAAIAAMIRLTADIPGVLVNHTDLDQHPFLLNVRNGTIDLRTGDLLDHNPEHLLTRQAPVIYDKSSQADLWSACLATWQPDGEMREYLQRVVGSGAAGHPVEAIFINLGEGGNGKSKFFGAIHHVLGPYAGVPHKSLLIATKHQQHETVMADMFGVRIAIAAETEAGERLDEASIKNLTGADVLEARRMREDRWKFKPTLTLFLSTNHRPRVRGSDEGVWRRVQLIRWDTTIVDRDEHLAGKLEAEASGILNWIVSGARQWLSGGLRTPQRVVDATKAYRGEEDHVGRFLDDVCRQGTGCWVSSADLRIAYEAWCHEVGEAPWSQRAMGPELTSRGFTRAKKGDANHKGWKGLELLPETDVAWQRKVAESFPVTTPLDG